MKDNKKKTIEFVRSEFEKRGYNLLSTEYKNSSSKLEFICPKGHKYFITWNEFRTGCNCGLCSSTKKLNDKEIRKYLINKYPELDIVSIQRIEEISQNSKKKRRSRVTITFKCTCGKIYTKNFDSLKKEQTKAKCDKCSYRSQRHHRNINRRKHTIDTVKNYLSSIGYTLLSSNYDKMNDKILVKCSDLNHKPFVTTFTSLFYNEYRCRLCSREKLSGKGHPNWKEDITDESRKLRRRDNKELNKWRRKVLKKYNKTCQITGLKEDLVVHHLDSYSINKEKRFDVRNGIVLTSYVHKLLHGFYGKTSTKKDFNKFLELWEY